MRQYMNSIAVLALLHWDSYSYSYSYRYDTCTGDAVLRLLLTLLCCWLSQPALATGQLTLLAEDDWAPYASVQNGQAHGMAVDIVRAAYQAVGVTVTFRSMPYARCMRLVEVGREVGCFDSLKDSTTLQRFAFGKQPLFTATIAIYGHQPESGITVAGLAGKRIGLTNGYTYGSQVEQDTRMFKDKAVSDLASMRKLAARRLDYALVYTRVAEQLQRQHGHELGGRLYRVGTVIENPLYVSFSQRNPRSESAMNQLDRGLQLLQQTGLYQQILQQWSAD